MKKKILITGGAGFIGYNLAKKYLDNNYKVDIVDNFKRGKIDFELKKLLKSRNIKLIKKDLIKTNVKEFKKNYDKIFHLAAIIGVKYVNKTPYNVLINNIKLLEKAIQIAQNQNKISKFIFFSTSEVYAGSLEHHGIKIPTPEKTPLTISNLELPRATYMLSKIYGEMMCNITKKLPHINIRPHNIYGPRMGFSHVIPELIKKMYFSKNNKVEILSPGHKRTFCYIDDAINQIYNLSNSRITNQTFNIGSDKENITIYDLAIKIAKLFDKKIILYRGKAVIGSPKNRCPDLTKLKKVIKIESSYNLNNGIEKTLRWYKKNIFQKKNKIFI